MQKRKTTWNMHPRQDNRRAAAYAALAAARARLEDRAGEEIAERPVFDRAPVFDHHTGEALDYDRGLSNWAWGGAS
jgi:hypothetical protein